MSHARRILAVGAIGVLVGVVPAQAANDPGWDNQWNMRVIGAEQAWAVGTGKGITIAVVDSGVHLTHEDLAGKLLPGQDFVQRGTPPQDDNGHGTHVAGIAAAFANNGRGVVGVAPDATVLPVKVLDENGSGASDIDEGIRWAVDNGAHVVNLSLGNLLEPISGPPFTEAIRYAWSRGVICVLATGNAFVTSSTFENEPAIVVTSTDRNDRIPEYATAVGDAAWGVAAPGGRGALRQTDDVFSSYWTPSQDTNRYAWLAGTSMAAPHVAGAAAVLRSLGLTPQQTVDRLLATAKDLGSPGRDDVYGHGRLDLAKAVAGLSPMGGTAVGAGPASSGSSGQGGAGPGKPGGVGGTAGEPANGAATGGGGQGSGRAAGSGSDSRGRSASSPTTAGSSGPDATTPAGEGDGAEGALGGPDRDPGRDGSHVPVLAVGALLALAAAGWAAVRARRLRGAKSTLG
jgi:subtilisin family serine protease